MANLKNLKVSKISYDAIREQAAATSGNVATLAYANAGATSEAAPYLIRVVSAGEQDLDAQCRAFVGKTEYTYEQARYFWNALMECVAEVLNDGVHTSVEFGYWRFALEVAGSVPSANSAPGPENAVWIAVYPSAELQSVAASIETQPNLAAQPFQIKEVFGHDHTPNKVTPNRQMLVMGIGLTMGGTGEKVELAKGTTVAQCTYVPREGDLNTRIRTTVPSTVPQGKGYQLRVTAKGKNGTELMTIVKENIEVLAPPPPTITKVATSGKTGVVKGQAFDAEGSDLRFATGDTAKVKWTSGGTPGELSLTPTGATATKISFPANDAMDAIPDNAEATFEFVIGGVTLTKKATILPREPIAQTDDGKCQVMTFKDGTSATEFTLGHAWTATGKGFYAPGTAPEGEWALDELGLTVDGKYQSFVTTTAEDHKSFTIASHSGDAPAPGTYENVTLEYNVTNGTESKTLAIPLAKLIVA